MSERPALHRVLASLHEAALDDAHFPTCSALIDDACGTHGNILTFARGQSRDAVEIYLARLYYRGERHHALERDYFDAHYPRDERVPRLIQPARQRSGPRRRALHGRGVAERPRHTTSSCPAPGIGTASTCAWTGRTGRASLGRSPIPSTGTAGRRNGSGSSGSCFPSSPVCARPARARPCEGAGRVPHRAAGQGRARHRPSRRARADTGDQRPGGATSFARAMRSSTGAGFSAPGRRPTTRLSRNRWRAPCPIWAAGG